MKTYKLLLSLFVSALSVFGLLAVLNPDKAAADVSREQVGNWYFKDGGWTDYAPNGVPDFDQKQNPWDNPPGSGNWTYCGPAAVANSLWWFDSKFEPSPVGPSGGPPSTMPISDSYYLVTARGGASFDDHDPQNVGGMGQPGLVDELAWYFDTDGVRTGDLHRGTEVHDMAIGLQWYLYGGNPTWGTPPFTYQGYHYYDDYHVQLVKMPTWDWVVEEVERSEDVILLLGFWQWDTSGSRWVRLGGHYVTVPGINAAEMQIAFSDPFLDNAGDGGPGRVLSGTLIAHNPPHPGLTNVHNDAGNVSHDYYHITTTVTSPAGLWEIVDYPYDSNFEEQNVPVEFIPFAGLVPGPILVEVEYALAMSPFKWKPGGEWVDSYWHGQWIDEWWWYKDDGDSCMPDFKWGDGELWYDGPTALTNSFWWFDSKAETLKTGGIPHPPPVITDHYDLIMPWGDWDDHDTRNITPTINTMASFLNTGISGTTRVSMTNGIGLYLTELSGVADDFYTKTQDTPSWEWIADEVETCEDVLMLLGFYEDIGGGTWQRKGGHWFLGLSDPAINNAVSPTLRTGRVFPPEHITTPFTPTEQLNPQALSHDIYRVITSTAFEGQLLLKDYPFTHTSVLTNFVGLNEGGDPIGDWGNQFETVIEWAIGVSPHSDLAITKTAVVTEVVPGDIVTYTLSYANTGLAAVENVTITDQLNLEHLTDVTYTTYPPIWATQGVTFAWTLPKLSYGQTGTITITGEALVTTTLYNEATITGTTSIGHPTPDKDQDDNSGEVGTPRYYLYLPLVLRNY